MKTRNKRFISLFVSMIMLLSSVTGLAANLVQPEEGVSKNILTAGTTEDNMPKLQLVYMEKEADGSFVEKGDFDAEALRKPAAGNAPFFYVGLKMSNFDRFVDNASGVRIFTAMMVYNNDYIAPIEDKNGGNVTVSQANDFRDAIYRNLQAVPTSYVNKTAQVYDDDLGENIDKPPYPEIRFTAISNGDNSTISNDTNKSALRGLQVNFTADSSFANGNLGQFKFDNDYLMIVRFRVKANAPDGTRVFGISQKDSTTVTFDNNKNYGYGLATSLEKYLKLDDSGVIIFPGSYTLEYYNSVNTDGTVKGDAVYTETIKENDPNAAKMDDAEKALEAPNEDDYFMGWKVADDDGDPTNDADFDGDISDLMPDDASTPIKVYADWATGYKVTFLNDEGKDPDTPDDVFATKYVKPEENSKLGADNMPKDADGKLINPTPEAGKAFSGWAYDDNGTEKEFKADETVIPEAGLVVYPKWTDQITVEYSIEGNVDEDQNDAGKPDDDYTLPTEDPEKENYTFVGWNTKSNGAGTYIKSSDAYKYSELLAIYKEDNDITEEISTVVLYAQFADIKDPDTDPDKIKHEPEQPADPNDDAVRVKFNSNAGDDNTVEDAKPLYKYPKIGDEIGTDNMPDEPTRDKYKFKEWNTKASGGGTAVNGTTKFTQDFVDNMDKAEDNDQEVQLYAIWEVADDDDSQADKITVTFDKNASVDGATDPSPLTREVIADDTLINLPEPPTQPGFKFLGWFTDPDASGMEEADRADCEVTADTPITKAMAAVEAPDNELTLYAGWSKKIKLVLEYRENNVKTDPVFDGNTKTPEIVEIWAQDPDDGDDEYSIQVTGDEFDSYKAALTLQYENEDGDFVDNPVNAGDYNVDVTVPEEMLNKGIDVGEVDPQPYTIEPMELNFKVENQQAQYAGDDGAEPATITVTTEGKTGFTDFKATYKKLELPEGDNEITAGKFSPTVIENPEAEDFADISSIGKYVIEISINDSNYTIGTIEADAYPKEADAENKVIYYPDGTKGKNIKYEITPNDPKATDLVVTKKDAGRDNPEALTEDDYTTPKQFTSDDEANKDTDKQNHYWVTVDKDTDAVDIYVDADTYYTVKINDEEKTLTNGTAKGTVDNLKKTIEVDESGVITKTDVENVITVEVGSAGSDPKTYTIHVRRLAEAQATSLQITEQDDPDSVYDLKDDNFEDDKPFTPNDEATTDPDKQNHYWVRIPKDKDSVDVLVSALGQGDKKITINGEEVTPDDDGVAKLNVNEIEKVLETNEDGTLKKDDDNNVIKQPDTAITVVIGEGEDTKTYTIYVRRSADNGGIDFKPGNSPYGLTERMHKKYHGEAGSWTKEQIAAVKAHLIDTSVDSTVRYMFEDDALPDNANAGIAYRPEAWGSVLYGESGHQASFEPEENMDMDSNALFIYQYEGFKDPGIFEIQDADGNIIHTTDDGVSVTLTAKGIQRFADLNDKGNIIDEDSVELVKYQAADDSSAEQEKDGFIYNLTTVNGNGNNTIRPDVYELEYTVKKDDTVIATAKRNLVVVARRGDFNMDGGLNDGDAGGMTDWAMELDRSIITILPLRSANMFFYKSFDVNLDGGVNDGDAGILSDIAQELLDAATLLKMYPTVE